MICEKLDDDASEEQQTAGSCTAFVEDSGGRILESRREAVWP